MVLTIPPGLDSQRALGSDWEAWLDRLPALADSVVSEWELTLDGESMHGFCSLVLPVRTRSGISAVLKLHTDAEAEESDHEHLVLQRWRGRGAVGLLRADPGRRALLLERLDQVDLTEHWDEEACEIVGRLYGRLHVPPMPQLREQASYVARWTDALQRDAHAVPVPRRLVDQAVSLARDLCQEPATAVIHGDLHYENVLRGERGGEQAWLVIDPKPTNGDPHYEIEPMLRNRFDEYGSAVGVGSVREGIRRRFHTLVDAAGFDEARARDWVVVRSILDAHWAHADAVRAGRPLSAEEREYVTRCITVAKAVQD
ncbi:aminoglycoside phosphotransferase family protein [Nocardioides sp. HM23]|uniref:aminoglycoside phosphotransferase family protein n=1 Tax=Nocardioides bizhenqiangii TaxID=3095076 RepID=UPI002ACAA833|nr:aminoglycoside phosphotransferase family protein [Nocardioides sp. HM23]MDZ5623215.1 aminoglycoside phosphotransferase family protein [Nocardioides sp. HM23]